MSYPILNYMNKGLSLFVLLAITAHAQYYTNSDRTDAVDDFCSNFEDRTELVDDDAQAENEGYKEVISNTLTTDGYLLAYIETNLLSALSTDPKEWLISKQWPQKLQCSLVLL